MTIVLSTELCAEIEAYLELERSYTGSHRVKKIDQAKLSIRIPLSRMQAAFSIFDVGANNTYYLYPSRETFKSLFKAVRFSQSAMNRKEAERTFGMTTFMGGTKNEKLFQATRLIIPDQILTHEGLAYALSELGAFHASLREGLVILKENMFFFTERQTVCYAHRKLDDQGIFTSPCIDIVEGKRELVLVQTQRFTTLPATCFLVVRRRVR